MSTPMTGIELHKGVMKLISALRATVPNPDEHFTQGRCYELAMVLRTVYPEGELWYSYKHGHMYYKLRDKYYDITGRHFKIPSPSSKYDFRDGHPAYRWNKD